MFDRLEFLMSEAFTALRRNTWMSFAAVTTVAMALFLLGGLGYGYMKVNAWIGGLESDFRIRVFAKSGITQDQRKETERKIMGIDGVTVVRFISKEDAMKTFAAENPDIDVSDLKGAENPLTDEFEVALSNIKRAKEVGDQIQKISTVEPDGVKYKSEYKELVENIVGQAHIISLVLGSIMLATGGILIYNAIRLTILARRREIMIMQLVGATRGTIWGPLMIEGTLQGAIGGVVASGFLWLTLMILSRVVPNLAVNAKLDVVPFGAVLLYLLPAGALYGLVCSIFAVRDPRSQTI